MFLIAHRGLVTKSIKENTMEAFMEALNSTKYAGIELDIRVSKDSEFVVYHDLLFKGKLLKHTLYKELKKENVPRLTDVLKINTGKIIMVEIKDFDIDIKRLSNLLNKYSNKNLYISSFNNEVLLKLKPYLKNAKIGSLNYVLNSIDDYNVFDFVCILNYLLTNELVKYFQNNNIEVFGYGIKNIKNIKHQNVYYIVDDKII